MVEMALARRRESKTNYRRRLRLLLGRKNRVVIRKSLKGFTVQFVKYSESSDQTLLEVSTKHLAKHGWKGHSGSIPSAYLTGFLFGKMAAKEGLDKGIIDIGLQSKESRTLFALASGVRDAGINVPLGAEISAEHIRGEHIAKYAKHLKESNPEKYKKQFSAYLKDNFNPETLPEHFDEVKKKIEEM